MMMSNQISIPVIKNVKETDAVLQSNFLVTANFGDFSNLEKKVWSIILSTVDEKQSEFIDFSITVENLMHLLNIDECNIHREIDKLTDKMMEKFVTIFDPSVKGFQKKQILLKIDLSNGVLNFKIHQDMSYYLLKILPYKENKKTFTSYILKETLKFSGKHTQSLYLFLKSFQGSMKNGQWFINESLDNIRCIFGFDSEKYKDWRDFYKRVLKSAETEINECDSSLFTIDKINPITEKKSITRLLFCLSIKTNNSKNPINQAQSIIAKFADVYGQKITEKYVLDNLLSVKSYEDVIDRIDLYSKYINTSTIRKTKSGLFKTLLQKDFIPVYSKDCETKDNKKIRIKNDNDNDKVPQLTNFKQREYKQEDFDGYYKNYDEEESNINN